MKRTVQPFSGLLYEDEASLSAELQMFLDSSETRNLLGGLILDDHLTQASMINKVGRPQATSRVEGHHLRGQRPETTQSAIAIPAIASSSSTPTEATSSACQGVSLLGNSNKDRRLFAGLMLFEHIFV